MVLLLPQAKKVLSAGNKEARVGVEGLPPHCSDELVVSRQEADKAWAFVKPRMQRLVRRALQRAGVEGVAVVEVVGGGCHVPAMAEAVGAAFPGVKVRRTLNAAEAVAKGCALLAAHRSAAFR